MFNFLVDLKISHGVIIKRHLVYFTERTQIPQFFQVHRGMKDYEMTEYRTRVLPFSVFAAEVLMV